MTIKEYAAKHGNYATARYLLNRRIQSVMGLHLEDLPDTSEIAEISERISEAIAIQDEKAMKAEVSEILSEVTFDFIESVCW